MPAGRPPGPGSRQGQTTVQNGQSAQRWRSAAWRLAIALLAAVSSASAAEMPAFPGAEGFGSQTPGGRGGKVLLVTNLNDSGPGSFRAACEAEGPRIVVFRVAGLLDLKSAVRIRRPYITIAGQTAPGDGLCLRGYGLIVETHDVVVRYLRSRPGDIAGVELDALSVGGQSRNVVIDHCSASWAIDENLSPSGGIADVTVEWCLIAEALNRSVHHKGAHGYGSLVRAAGGLSLHHNLWAHNQSRNPRLGDNYGRGPFPVFDVRNNVVYDFGSPSLAGDALSVNYVGNYLKPGPSTPAHRAPLTLAAKADASFYFAGNVVAGRPQLTANPVALFERTELGGRKLVALAPQPFPVPEVRTVSAEEAYRLVLAGAGATLPVRDAVDERIVAQVRNGRGSLIDSSGKWAAGRLTAPPARPATPTGTACPTSGRRRAG